MNINNISTNAKMINNNNSRYVIANDEEMSNRIITQEEESKPQIPPFKQIGGRKRV